MKIILQIIFIYTLLGFGACALLGLLTLIETYKLNISKFYPVLFIDKLIRSTVVLSKKFNFMLEARIDLSKNRTLVCWHIGLHISESSSGPE